MRTPPSKRTYFVYVVKNLSNGTPYIGYTKDLERRMSEHQRKFPKDKLFYYEAYLYEEDARKREMKLKHYGSAWKSSRERIGM